MIVIARPQHLYIYIYIPFNHDTVWYTMLSILFVYPKYNPGVTVTTYWYSTCISMYTDRDECALGQDNCNPNNATCTNTMGSFDCECLPAFSGDGVTCEGQKLLYTVLHFILWEYFTLYSHARVKTSSPRVIVLGYIKAGIFTVPKSNIGTVVMWRVKAVLLVLNVLCPVTVTHFVSPA